MNNDDKELEKLVAAHRAEVHAAPEHLKEQWHAAIASAAALVLERCFSGNAGIVRGTEQSRAPRTAPRCRAPGFIFGMLGQDALQSVPAYAQLKTVKCPL